MLKPSGVSRMPSICVMYKHCAHLQTKSHSKETKFNYVSCGCMWVTMGPNQCLQHYTVLFSFRQKPNQFYTQPCEPSVRWRTKSKLPISVIFGCLDKRHQDPRRPRQVCRVLTVKGGHNPLLPTIQRHLPERSA